MSGNFDQNHQVPGFGADTLNGILGGGRFGDVRCQFVFDEEFSKAFFEAATEQSMVICKQDSEIAFDRG